jgi:RNA polymerase sigma-70 factor (ECF subfamily)
MQLAIAPRQVDLEEASDAELVELARQGVESAVRAIVGRYNRRLFRVARGVVRDDAEAEDIVQETYVRAFTHLDSFRGQALLSTWLTRIALNEALGRVRRRRSTVELDELETESSRQGGCLIMFPSMSPSASPEAEAGRNQVRQVLESAVDDLPEAFRVVFVLRDVEGMSTEETAAQLSLKTETVKTRLHRARRLLRTAVAKRLETEFSGLFPFAGARCAQTADRVVERLRSEGMLKA